MVSCTHQNQKDMLQLRLDVLAWIGQVHFLYVLWWLLEEKLQMLVIVSV